MNEQWLVNWFWPVVGTALAVSGLLLSLLIFRWSQNRRQLLFESMPLLIEVLPGADLFRFLTIGQLPFDSFTWDNVRRLSLFRIKNVGNQPIAPADFVRDIVFSFAEPTHVLAVNVLASNPANIDPVVLIDPPRVILKPILLNQGESIVFRAFIGTGVAEVSMDARLAGTSLITSAKLRLWPHVIGWVACFASALWVLRPLLIRLAVPDARMLWWFYPFIVVTGWQVALMYRIRWHESLRMRDWGVGPETGVWGIKVPGSHEWPGKGNSSGFEP